MGKGGNFWLGVIIGWILMLVLTPVFPVLGTVIGGFVAGLVARGGFWNGGKAGFIAGLFGALIISLVLLVGGTFLLGFLGFIVSFGIGLVLIIIGLYYAVLGFVGGSIGGLLAK